MASAAVVTGKLTVHYLIFSRTFDDTVVFNATSKMTETVSEFRNFLDVFFLFFFFDFGKFNTNFQILAPRHQTLFFFLY